MIFHYFWFNIQGIALDLKTEVDKKEDKSYIEKILGSIPRLWAIQLSIPHFLKKNLEAPGDPKVRQFEIQL
jgi:hypothetical protein